ncbi:MAG: hypothetical protein KF847_15815 [Pirellulales bacterium]|nr:hypothetical protein [Pirellulales bacterium]
MTSRRATKSADAIALFPFLAVLLCTMGGLLVLLVVLSEAAKRRVERVEPTSIAEAPADAERRAAVVAALRELEAEQAKLGELRRQAADKLREEQARLAHSEDAQRRLEHDLAKLHIAAEQLKAAENNQTVDRLQAAAELRRLDQLVRDTQQRLDESRNQDTAPKSYAIVPYQGASGTYRKPIFVECVADGVVIQPEGIKLSADDFLMASRAGNPLAAAIRAAREKLNSEARQTGTEPPNAYPLLIVRPEGDQAYFAAVKAIRAWDGDFGYEFVESDAKLRYAAPDPVLADVMSHAVMQSRERMQALAEAAPSRFAVRMAGGGRGTGAGGGGSGLGGGEGNGDGSAAGSGDFAASGGSTPYRSETFNREQQLSMQLAGGGEAASGGGLGSSAGNSGEGGADFSGAGSGAAGGPGMLAGSATGGGGSAGAGSTSATTSSSGSSSGSGTAGTGAGAGGGAGGQSGPSLAGSASGSAGATSSGQTGAAAATAMNSSSSAAAGAPGADAGDPSQQVAGGAASSSSAAMSADPDAVSGIVSIPNSTAKSASSEQSLAKTRGVDWALNLASRNAAPISRPIQAIVRADSISVQSNRFADPGAQPTGSEVRLDQPTDKAVDELVDALRSQVKTWGLAGQNLYWKPVLVVTVEPGAEPNATKLARLLEGSGIDVRLPETAARTGTQEPSHATR